MESGVRCELAFERLVQELASDHLVCHGPERHRDRQQLFEAPLLLLTDHIPMPKKTFHSLERLGARKSPGPEDAFASQCVVLIHHALDRQAPSDVARH